MAKNEVMFVEDVLKDAVQNFITSRLDVVKGIGEAKKKLSKKAYKELIGLSGLSKDQVSISLKRYELLILGFGEHYISDYSDRIVKVLTNKKISEQGELLRARKQLADGDIDWDDFKELYDSFKVVKTDDEKIIKKAEDLVKFSDTKNIGAEAMIKVAEIVAPFNEYLDKEG